MLRTMITAANTMGQLQQNLDVVGNNLANSATHGYKAQQASFQELMYQQYNNDKQDVAPRQTADGIRYGVGAKMGQVQTNWKVGSLQNTERGLDFALTSPKQYFNVIMPTENGEETVYTRQGAFYVTPVADNQVMLVNDDGNPIADENGMPIVFSDRVKDYHVKPGGVLQIVNEDDTIESINLGISYIDRPNVMEHISGTYIGLPRNMEELGIQPGEVVANLQGGDRAQIGLENRMLEMSNVNYEKEMTDLMNVQRNYQFNSRAISIADQMLGLINGIR
ncbi:MAG TPA: flagellar hook-basal body protein [Sporosarcina sp.]|nr:flagellar hook-basal body protein [Sporosarcina sp.]